MLNKGQKLLDDHNVMRHVSWAKLRRDGDDNVIGFLPSAFELREAEEYLSVNWLEYFPGNRTCQITECVKEFRSNLNVRPKSAFGISGVKRIKEVCQGVGKSIRIVYSPTANNLSHASIYKLPRNEFSLFESLASDAFTEIIMNSQIP